MPVPRHDSSAKTVIGSCWRCSPQPTSPLPRAHAGQTSSQPSFHQHPLRKVGLSCLGCPSSPGHCSVHFYQSNEVPLELPNHEVGQDHLSPSTRHPIVTPRSPAPYLQSAPGVYSSRSEGTEAPSSSLACSGSRRGGSPAAPPGPPGTPCWPAWCSCRGRPGTAAACGTGSCSWARPRTARWLAHSPRAPASHGGPAPAGTGGRPASGGSHLGEGQGARGGEMRAERGEGA